MVCLPDTTFPRGREADSREELAGASLCSGTLSPTSFSLNSCSHSGISELNGARPESANNGSPRSIHIVGPRRNTQIFRVWSFFSSHRGNLCSKHGSIMVNSIFTYFTLSLSASQIYMIFEICWFSQINFFIEYFPHRINIVFLSSQFYVIHIHR